MEVPFIILALCVCLIVANVGLVVVSLHVLRLLENSRPKTQALTDRLGKVADNLKEAVDNNPTPKS